jgi:hypothetical protein
MCSYESDSKANSVIKIQVHDIPNTAFQKKNISGRYLEHSQNGEYWHSFSESKLCIIRIKILNLTVAVLL